MLLRESYVQNNIYYFYAILPNREGNFTLRIKDALYSTAGELKTDEIIKNYPELEKEDIYQAAKYGAWLASEKTIAIA